MLTLHRWDPFAEISRITDEFNRNVRPARFVPAVDIYEDAESLVLRAELPGVDPKDVDVSVDKNVLTVRGERKQQRSEEKEGWHRVESSYGQFTRSFTLPQTVDSDAIDANLEQGILTLRLPKKTAPQPKKVAVSVKS
ncbi:MAG: Hsp20/alpha crystallin family protein [Myxococcales bacterium]|nr:Hsp20/alpha crystallin family protein [Myxococcales bacterium]